MRFGILCKNNKAFLIWRLYSNEFVQFYVPNLFQRIYFISARDALKVNYLFGIPVYSKKWVL